MDSPSGMNFWTPGQGPLWNATQTYLTVDRERYGAIEQAIDGLLLTRPVLNAVPGPPPPAPPPRESPLHPPPTPPLPQPAPPPPALAANFGSRLALVIATNFGAKLGVGSHHQQPVSSAIGPPPSLAITSRAISELAMAERESTTLPTPRSAGVIDQTTPVVILFVMLLVISCWSTWICLRISSVRSARMEERPRGLGKPASSQKQKKKKPGYRKVSSAQSEFGTEITPSDLGTEVGPSELGGAADEESLVGGSKLGLVRSSSKEL